MYKKFNIKIIIILITILSSYFILHSIIGSNKLINLKSLLNNEQKFLIKKYIFPHKLPPDIVKELKFIKDGKDIEIIKSSIKLSNNKTLKKYKLNSGFYAGSNNINPGNGYLDFYEGNIFILSTRGVLAFRENLNNNEKNFKQIQSNINDFIGLKEFAIHRSYSIKDLLVSERTIFVSYTEEIKDDCWNTGIIFGTINYENIKFKKLFSSRECVHSIDNIDKEFKANQSGGRIVSFDDSHILFSIGEYRSRHLAQDKQSVNGKIIKINIINSDYEIISMGHRNPQGLYFDKENNFILETEHGPKGGDEINLIEVEKISKDKIQNYGWAIASAGEHYGVKSENNKKKYEKYPLYNSHIEHGFIEPLWSFVPSIGISEIVKIGQNKYVVSSMKNKSIYFFELNKQREIINLDRIEVFERVRDLRFNNDNNQLYLFMEDSPSIGIINLN